MLSTSINPIDFKSQKNDLDVVERVLQQLAEKVRLLQRKNKEQQVAIKEHEHFRKTVGQMLHDIQAPVLGLQAVSESVNELPEQKRITLRSSIISIADITTHALHQFKPKSHAETANNLRQPILVSSILSEIINDRQNRYKDLPIKFEFNLTGLNAFEFIKAAPSDLRRSISNLVNNAVDALPKSGGKIELKIKSNEEWVYISILDDGRGMSDETLAKIRNSIAVTVGKENGHGIGLTQVRDMLTDNHGTFEIASSQAEKNHGTTVILRFPKISVPHWSTDTINLYPDDTVIVLSEDTNVHEEYDKKCGYILEKIPSVTVKHFFKSTEVHKFLKDLSDTEIKNLCFLCDYELVGSKINGLELIKTCGIKRSILIANQLIDSEVKKLVVENNIKMVFKELIPVVALNVCQAAQLAKGKLANVHMVFLDDEKTTMNALVREYYSHLIVDQYSNPFEFLDKVDNYPKDTKFILDNYYYAEDGNPYNIDGIGIAEKLHEKGYTNLFLLSGESFSVPDYLTLVLKIDKEKIKKLDTL